MDVVADNDTSCGRADLPLAGLGVIDSDGPRPQRPGPARSRCWRRNYAPGTAHSTPAYSGCECRFRRAGECSRAPDERHGSASETKYSVGCGLAFAGDGAGDRQSSACSRRQKETIERQQNGLVRTVRRRRLTRWLSPHAAISAWPAASRRSRRSRRWKGSRPHRPRADSGADRFDNRVAP